MLLSMNFFFFLVYYLMLSWIIDLSHCILMIRLSYFILSRGEKIDSYEKHLL